ncbi:MAG: hypothetical protein FH748_02540 [Balneolaceae bacterium]|nr:hypothetical protein [Balneolaceae bacterium]
MASPTDIFKLFFHHDMRLDKLAKRNANRTKEEVEATLADFMKPDPTYSKFYLTGTDLANERFGLNTLTHYQQVLSALEQAFDSVSYFTAKQKYNSLNEAIPALELGEVVVLAKSDTIDFDVSTIHIDTNSNVGHFKSELKEALEQELIVVYKEQAKDGFDLHIFSKKNIYRDMFFPLQELVPDAFRFFSINGKKFRSERHFYFETWALHKPPHGFEEVFPESVL